MFEIIHLIHILSQAYKVSNSRAAIKTVRCEQCGTEYVYLLTRTVTASGFTHGGAERKAKQWVQKAVKEGADVVPCPECGWVQTEMIRQNRQALRRHLPPLVGVFGIVWLIPLVVAAIVLMPGKPNPAADWIAAGCGLLSLECLLSAVGLIVAHFVHTGIDPNAMDREERIALGRRLARRREEVADELENPEEALRALPGGKALARREEPITLPLWEPEVRRPQITREVQDGQVILEGAVLKEVTCESCAEEYVYLLKRTRQYSAQVHPQTRRYIEGYFRESLKQQFDPVPCPVCGWFQSYMVEDHNRPRKRWNLLFLFIGPLVALFLGAAVFGGFAKGLGINWPLPLLGLLALGTVVVFPLATWIILQIVLRNRLRKDLNSTDADERIRLGQSLARRREEVSALLNDDEDQDSD